MNNMIKIAGIQMSAGMNKAANIKWAIDLLGIAKKKGAGIACLPQLFNTHWFPIEINNRNFELAESVHGSTITTMREAAQRLKMALILPIFEKDGGTFFNTAFVIDENGDVIGRYRKMHVPQIPLWEERSYFEKGDLGFCVFNLRGLRLGVLLCWDIFFPEAPRILALKGAQMIFVPTASAFYDQRRKWDRAIAASAHANGLYIFRVNRVGKEGKLDFYGRSLCIGPNGDPVDSPSGSSEGVILIDVDLNKINEGRNIWPFLKDRRIDAYEEILED
jgi:N-carbamoylputrescine amidase